MKNQRYEILDPLRGIAALLVCICHFRFALPDGLASAAKMGELGVYTFFVISGFIIPFSMAKSGYTIDHFRTFWAKRLLRLHPTFLVAVAATFVLSGIGAVITGSPSEFSLVNLVKAAFYLWVPTDNPVIWTLIVELKYYLFISLLFPVLFSAKPKIRRTAFFCGLALCAIARPVFADLQYLPYFFLGFAACYLAIGRTGAREASVLAFASLCIAVPGSSGAPVILGLLTWLVIVWQPKAKWRFGAFLGTISYSLYLIHFPLGGKFLNFTLPRVAEPLHVVLFFSALTISLLAAYVIYFLVERPSCKWSQKMKFKKREPEVGPAILLKPDSMS